jgi:hypothetical protein
MDEEYARELSRHAVLRTCLALGIKTAREDCLDVIGDVIRHFVQTIAVRTRDCSEAGGRTHGGIQDILPVLESMGPFDVSWKTLKDFGLEVDDAKSGANSTKWDQPFPFEVPEFPIQKSSTAAFGFETDSGRENIKHDGDTFVPSFLLPYPSSHTYQSQLGKKRRAEEVQHEDSFSKRPKPILNTKHARESLMKLENLPTVSDVPTV